MVTWPGFAIMLMIVLGTAFSSATVEASTAGSTVWHAPIAIRGDSGFTPANGVVSGSGIPENPYLIEGWDVSVTNSQVFFLPGFRAGILVEDTRAHFVIRNVLVRDGPWSSANVVLKNATNGKVESSRVINGNIGILFWNSVNNSAAVLNEISNMDFAGLYFDNSTWNVARENLIQDSESPVLTRWSSYNAFIANKIEQLSYPYTVSGVSSLERESSFNIFEGNSIRGGHTGIEVAINSHFNLIRGNRIEQVDASGVAVGIGSRGNVVENNTIINSGRGVLLNQAFETRIHGNMISAFVRTSPPGFELTTGKGVWVLRSFESRITGNIIVAPVGISICESKATFIAPPPNDLTGSDRPVQHCR